MTMLGKMCCNSVNILVHDNEGPSGVKLNTKKLLAKMISPLSFQIQTFALYGNL